MSDVIDQSNGFLPLAALRHADPTAIGLFDLDAAADAAVPAENPTGGSRDQLLLVRLHQQPLAFVHLQEPWNGAAREALVEVVWRAASAEIIAHIRSCGCLPVPADSGELSHLLEQDGGRCPGSLPSRPDGRAAVIVCSIGNGEALARTLRSLGQMTCDDFEVIVVDNRPAQPETRATVQRLASELQVTYVAEPRAGLAIARNAGVAAATEAAFVAFTDDDVVVDPQWLSWLLAGFVRAEVAATTGLVVPLTLRSRVEKRFEQYAGFGKGLRGALYDMSEHRAGDRFLYPYWGGMFGSGNSMAFRRRALLEAGGFDPALGAGTLTAGGEDLAAFTDVILAGGAIAYEPRSLCWHEHRADEGALRAQVRNYGIGLTAVLWRYFRSDWRFSATLLRSLPLILRLARQRADDREVERLPRDLARLELQGRLRGPWQYELSRRRTRTSRVPPPPDRRGVGPEPDLIGVARRGSGGRHRETDQAQTRT